jgi:hypothetical protein
MFLTEIGLGWVGLGSLGKGQLQLASVQEEVVGVQVTLNSSFKSRRVIAVNRPIRKFQCTVRTDRPTQRS